MTSYELSRFADAHRELACSGGNWNTDQINDSKHLRSFITAAAGVALIVTNMTAGQMQTTDTHIGKLSFENGFPSKETVQKIFDEMDYQRAVQAYCGHIGRFPSGRFPSSSCATSALI